MLTYERGHPFDELPPGTEGVLTVSERTAKAIGTLPNGREWMAAQIEATIREYGGEAEIQVLGYQPHPAPAKRRARAPENPYQIAFYVEQAGTKASHVGKGLHRLATLTGETSSGYSTWIAQGRASIAQRADLSGATSWRAQQQADEAGGGSGGGSGGRASSGDAGPLGALMSNPLALGALALGAVLLLRR